MIVLVLVTIEKSNAQDFHFGILGGFDKVNIHQKPKFPNAKGPPYRPMESYNFNCFISYKSNSFWGFCVEPGFIQKGGSNGVNNCCRWELNYLQIPFSTDIYVLPRLFISIGPEVSYLLSAKAVNDYPGHVHTDDMSSIYKYKFELSGLAGINFRVNKVLDIGLRYNHGFTNIAKIDVTIFDGPNWYIFPVKQKSQYLQIRVRAKLFNFSKSA